QPRAPAPGVTRDILPAAGEVCVGRERSKLKAVERVGSRRRAAAFLAAFSAWRRGRGLSGRRQTLQRDLVPRARRAPRRRGPRGGGGGGGGRGAGRGGHRRRGRR